MLLGSWKVLEIFVIKRVKVLFKLSVFLFNLSSIDCPHYAHTTLFRSSAMHSQTRTWTRFCVLISFYFWLFCVNFL